MNRSQYDNIVAKCQESGTNTYDTKKYRYRFLATGELVRCDVSVIGTTAGLDPNEWETVTPEEEKPKYKRTRTDAQRAGEARYKAKAEVAYSLRLNRNTDADIIEFLERRRAQGLSIQGYIKDCIRYAYSCLHTD